MHAANSVNIWKTLYLLFHVLCVLFRFEKTQLKIHAGIFQSSFSLYNRPWETFQGPILPTLKSSPQGGLNMPAAFQWYALHPLSSLLFSSNHLFSLPPFLPLIAPHLPSLCSIFSAKLSVLSKTIHTLPHRLAVLSPFFCSPCASIKEARLTYSVWQNSVTVFQSRFRQEVGSLQGHILRSSHTSRMWFGWTTLVL